MAGHSYFDPTAYDCLNVTEGGTIPLFTFGNSGRNSVRGPGINNADLSLFQNIKFSERMSLQLGTEFFNAFNHKQFFLSGNSASAKGFNSAFGQVTQTRPLEPGTGGTGARVIQFALKLSF